MAEGVIAERGLTLDEAARGAALIGTVFDGKYLITRQLGQGGFGSVYEGRDIALGVTVAIKMVHAEDARDGNLQAALQEEARRVTRLRHPHVVDWKAFARTAEGVSYFVMERLQGQSLQDVLEQQGRLSEKRTIDILLQVLDALRTAHQGGPDGPILHLDLKPANILLEPHPSGHDGDWVKLIDFGLGQFSATSATSASPAARAGDADLTLSDVSIRSGGSDATTTPPVGAHAGVVRLMSCTPNYTAPEHGAHLLTDVEPPELDHRCDLYSLGVIAFRMLTGCLPFQGGNDYEEVLRAKLTQDAPHLGRICNVSRQLAAFVDRCLRRNRDERWQTTEEAWKALQRIAHRGRWHLIGGVAATAAVAAGLLVRILVGASTPGFDVFAISGGEERELSRSRLYLGPARPLAQLRPTGIEVQGTPAVRCLTGPGRNAAAVTWLTAAWEDPGAIGLRASPGDSRRAEVVYLEVASAGNESRYSQPFEVVYLPEARDCIEEMGVEDLEKRALDPTGEKLHLRLTPAPDDVEQVEVAGPGGVRVLAVAVPTVDGQARFEVELERLDLSSGPCTITATATDRAGGEGHRSFSCRVSTEALRLETLKLEGIEFGQRTMFGPQAPAAMRLRLNGAASVEWTVLHESGRRIGGGRQEVTRDLSVALTGIGGEQDFEGRVEVLVQDQRYVHRRQSQQRGTVTEARPFVYASAGIDWSVAAGTAGDMRDLREGDPLYLASERVNLRVARRNAVPMRVTVSVLGQAGEKALGEARLDTRIGDAWEQEVSLSAGTHELLFRARRLLAGEQPELTAMVRRAIIVVDLTAPTLAADVRRLEVGTRAAPPLVVQAQDGGAGVVRDVRWQVRAVDRVLGGGLIAAEVRSGGSCTLSMDSLPVLDDGDHELVVSASDLAANEAQPLVVPLTVARKGPVLRSVMPNGSTWTSEPDGSFAIEVKAEDQNGVQQVECVIGGGAAVGSRISLARGTDVAPGPGLWRGSVRPRAEWAGAELTVLMTATDSRGNVSTLRVIQRIGSIEQRLPTRVAVAVLGSHLASMRFVRGNDAGPYVFGGRGDDVETRLFRESALPTFNPLTVSRSWLVQCPAGQIEDYYLDEDEVTVAQFIRFLRDAAGWSRQSNWSSGAVPASDRLQALERDLADANPELPVTGVTWDEAHAFATWSGRRLPTFVELEYAVRGGLQYRPCSYPVAPGAAARVNLEGNVAWPVGQGDDLAADTGIRNLSSNVAEWSQTPDAGAGRNADARSHLRIHDRESLVAATAFWSVGATYRDRSPNFLAADVLPRRSSARHIGFRCATSARVLSKQLDQAVVPVRFEAMR